MNNNTILITGGTGKLGLQYIKHFYDKGWNVVFTSTKIENINKAKKIIGSNLIGIKIDFTKKNASKILVKNLTKQNIKINHLVNNARSQNFLNVNDVGLTSQSDFMNEYLLDVYVPYQLSMELYINNKRSLKTITNIGSQYGVVPTNPYLYKNHSKEAPIQYSLAKAALNHLTKELAVRFSNSDIRVNCIAYGGVEGRVNNDFKKRYSKLNLLGRMMRENEVIGPLDFIISDSGSYITGQIICVDGGWAVC